MRPGADPGAPNRWIARAPDLLASDQQVVRAVERHEPVLADAKAPPGAEHRDRADGEALAEREHGHGPAALSAMLLRHSGGRLQNRRLECVSTSRELLAVGRRALVLLAHGGSLSLELFNLVFERCSPIIGVSLERPGEGQQRREFRTQRSGIVVPMLRHSHALA